MGAWESWESFMGKGRRGVGRKEGERRKIYRSIKQKKHQNLKKIKSILKNRVGYVVYYYLLNLNNAF